MNTIRATRIGVSGALAALGILAASLLASGSAIAADGFDATVAGQRGYSPLVNLVQSSTLTVDVRNLPSSVGLYALHCKVPSDPRQAPTVCDQSTGAAAYLPGVGEARATAALPIKVNAEFWGTNPNPASGVVTGESVDCRVPTGDPRSTTCALYVLGAGRESANPTYLRVFPTAFVAAKAARSNDVATITLAGKTVERGAKPTLTLDKPVPFSVSLKSGLTANVSSDTCSIKDGSITALKDQGACTVLITSTGGSNYKPLVKTQVFLLR